MLIVWVTASTLAPVVIFPVRGGECGLLFWLVEVLDEPPHPVKIKAKIRVIARIK